MTNRARDSRRSDSSAGAEQNLEAAVPDQELEFEPLEVPSAISVHDLAELMDAGPVEVIKVLMRMGFMFTINDVLEHDVAASVATSFGFDVHESPSHSSGSGSLVISSEGEDPSLLVTRPPVVTILGHVDHGKTTLLDSIRSSNLVAKEAGGITQRIGAYQVTYRDHIISFLDTPGHEAFTAMRARGAQVTDIAVLVVAADDGIMPQTLEAIDHTKAAGVPIIVAINKIDRPDADPERVKRQLAEQDLLIEEWGGDVISMPVSALTGEGINELLDNVLVVAEVAELKANPSRLAKGVIVEARRDKSRGTIATVLVQTGTLKVGDNIVVDNIRGRVRAMFDDKGDPVEKAGPSMPVEVLGMPELPEAGYVFEVAPDEKTARRWVDQRTREKELQRIGGPTLEDVYSRMESGEVKSLNLLVKTDVQGSNEPVRNSLEQLSTEKAKVNVIRAASGSITESDVLLATASQAIIIGFNTRVEPGARALANQEGIEIRFYNVIYTLIEEIDQALEGLLDPVYEDVIEGRATVRAIFNLGRRATVAGVYVNDGHIARNATIHVIRNNDVLYVGRINSLKHFKDDAREIATGFEGGIMLDGFNDYLEGDILEAHQTERVS